MGECSSHRKESGRDQTENDCTSSFYNVTNFTPDYLLRLQNYFIPQKLIVPSSPTGGRPPGFLFNLVSDQSKQNTCTLFNNILIEISGNNEVDKPAIN